MKFEIFSKKMAESSSHVESKATEPHIWISFYSPPRDNKTNLWRNKHCLDHIQIGCLDILSKSENSFNENMAKQILNFVNKNKDKVNLICVNCEAGISRSSGCVVALSKILNGHDYGIFEALDEEGFMKYSPNTLIIDIIEKAHQYPSSIS